MASGEFEVFFDDAKRATMLRSVFETYHTRSSVDSQIDRVVFDTNRTWTGRAALLGEMYPTSRIICCVRDAGWIIDSVERMLAKNPMKLSRIFNFQPGASVYARVEILMNSEHGLVGGPWSTLREAWFGEQAKRLIVLPYDHLVKEPKRTLHRLYSELGEKPFEHDLENVTYDEPDFDAHIGMPGLHTVRQKVEYRERMPCIPPDIFVKYASNSFWDKPDLNTRDVTII